jgi:hypothetical protein
MDSLLLRLCAVPTSRTAETGLDAEKMEGGMEDMMRSKKK